MEREGGEGVAEEGEVGVVGGVVREEGLVDGEGDGMRGTGSLVG